MSGAEHKLEAALQALDQIGLIADEMGAAHTFDQWDDLCVRLREALGKPTTTAASGVNAEQPILRHGADDAPAEAKGVPTPCSAGESLVTTCMRLADELPEVACPCGRADGAVDDLCACGWSETEHDPAEHQPRSHDAVRGMETWIPHTEPTGQSFYDINRSVILAALAESDDRMTLATARHVAHDVVFSFNSEACRAVRDLPDVNLETVLMLFGERP